MTSLLSQTVNRTIILARLAVPVTAAAVQAILTCYTDECSRLGYPAPEIAYSGHVHYQPGFITIIRQV